MRSEKKAKLAKYQSYQTFVIRVMILAMFRWRIYQYTPLSLHACAFFMYANAPTNVKILRDKRELPPL